MSTPASPVAFPLPEGYFNASRTLSENQQQQYRALVRDRLNATIVSERMLRSSQRSRRLGSMPGAVTRVDPKEWKPVRSKHDLRVFRHRDNGRSPEALASKEDHRDVARAVEAGQPSLLCIGRVEGSLEEVLYGFHNPTHQDMQAVMRHVDERVLDCASLATIETGADDARKHPMHYLGLKWSLSKLPGSLVVLPRDVCYVEALGVANDYDGRPVGFFIQHSVDDPLCPPFDERATGIMRARVFFTYLFRENTPGFVDVFARGVFDAAGLIPKFVSAVTTSMLLGLFSTVRCAQAKKLTLLAKRRGAGLMKAPEASGRPQCGICSRRQSALDLTRPRTCRICHMQVCSRCRSDRTMFVRSSMGAHVSLKKVDCCITCVLDAKIMTGIRPYDPGFALFSTEGQQLSGKTLGDTTAATTALPTQQQEGPVERSTISSSGNSNSNDNYHSNMSDESTASGSGSALSERSKYVDTHGMSSRSIISAGFVDAVVDEACVSIDEYADCMITSDVEDSEYGSELEQDVTDDEADDEAVDVDTFNRDTTPVVNELLVDVETRGSVKVGAAYEAFTKQYTREEPVAQTPPPSVGSSSPMSLFETIMALQTSVQETYSLTQANQELMAKMMRHK